MSEKKQLTREYTNLMENAQEIMQDKRFKKMTTSKLRSLMTLVNNIYNKVYLNRNEELSDDIIQELEYLKIRFIYEIARDKEKIIEVFYTDTSLDSVLDDVIITKSRSEFMVFARYFEALLAYFKLYHDKGGDN